MFGSRSAILAAALAIAWLCAMTRADGMEPRSNEAAELKAPAITAEEFARALLEETNRVRRAQGRARLKAKRELQAAAEDQAAFMALRMQVQHESFLRGQETPFDRVRRHGLFVERGTIGENVASTTLGNRVDELGAAGIAAALVEQWMNSPGHRAMLLDRNVTHFGGAVRLSKTVGGHGWAAYGAQVFLVAPARFGSGI